MATTDLKLEEVGSLPRPGPIGRLARLALGSVCVWFVVQLAAISGELITADGHLRLFLWNGLVIGLCLISYIINIGFSCAWRKWPAIVSGGVFLALAGIGYLTERNVETHLLAGAIWGWELYLFTHLGAAFVISGLIGTPGCEMRAFHDLFSRLTGIPTKEHYCPVGPLHPIDQWEANRSKR